MKPRNVWCNNTGNYLRMPMATSMRTLLMQAQIRQPTKSSVIKILNHRGSTMTSLSATYPSNLRASTISLMLTSDNSQTLWMQSTIKWITKIRKRQNKTLNLPIRHRCCCCCKVSEVDIKCQWWHWPSRTDSLVFAWLNRRVWRISAVDRRSIMILAKDFPSVTIVTPFGSVRLVH